MQSRPNTSTINATVSAAARALHALCLLLAVICLSAPAPLFAQGMAAPSPTPRASMAAAFAEQASFIDKSFERASFEDEAILSDSQLSVVPEPGHPNYLCEGEGASQNCLTYRGFFVGLGGSYNSVKLDQDNRTSATSEVFSGSTLVAAGAIQEQYAAYPASNTLSGLSPMIEVGYFRNLARDDGSASDWLWGSKFAYKYLDLTFAQSGDDSIPGSIYENTPAAPPGSTFTGHNFIGSAQTWVSHELALTFFVGHELNRGQVYLGGGPVGFSTETRIYHPTSFVEINGVQSDVTGGPNNLYDHTWMLGGIGQVGAMFDLGHSCFVDLSYDFILTRPYIKDYSIPFSTTTGGYTDIGNLDVSTFQAITAHSFNVILLKKF